MEEKEEAIAVRNLAETIFAQRDMEGIMNFIFPEIESGFGVPNNCDDRNMFVAVIKNFCIKNNITHFYMLSEVYVSKAEDGVMPSENPNRIEMFAISHIRKEGTTVQLAEIHNAGPSRFLGEWKEQHDNASSIWEQCL